MQAKRYASLQSAVDGICGDGTKIIKSLSVSGGDINRAYVLRLSGGQSLFMKENRADNLNFFVREAEGLDAIKRTGAIRVPEVYAYGTDGGSAFLLMECIEEGSRSEDFFEDFGRQLADMHAAECSYYTEPKSFGFTNDNYIGAGFQENTPEEKWVDFFRNRRLLPQIRRAEHYFGASEYGRIDALLEKLDDILVEPAKPALLHGDLWAGNYMTGNDGRAWLIDPAVYVGHPEADIAMTELFGGYPGSFYEGYFNSSGLPEGYADRRDIYNLYHLFNHLNLFGGSYYGSVMRIVKHYT